MSQFTLTWDNTPIQGNANVTQQEASNKPKTGSTWNTSGYSPANPLAVSATTTTSPDVPDNVIHQFRINSLCSTNGPMTNLGGVKEVINFACIIPTLSDTGTTASAVVSLVNTSITKVRFTLRKDSGNPPAPSDTIVMQPTVVNKNTTSNNATITASGTTFDEDYYWEIELYTTLRNNNTDVEVISSNPTYLGATCKTKFTTSPPPTCAAVTNLVVTSVGN